MSLKERLPEVLPLFRDSQLATVIEAVQAEFDGFRSDTDAVQDSLFIDTADGGSLDQIGADFGLIGRRRGRGDTAYRQFLRSVVPAFDGRGTERDVEVAVAAGVARAPLFVDLRQDFDNREYEVELFDWSAHRTGTVHDLADLADPVAVDRVDPVYYFSDEIAVAIGSQPTETGIENHLRPTECRACDEPRQSCGDAARGRWRDVDPSDDTALRCDTRTGRGRDRCNDTDPRRAFVGTVRRIVNDTDSAVINVAHNT